MEKKGVKEPGINGPVRDNQLSEGEKNTFALFTQTALWYNISNAMVA